MPVAFPTLLREHRARRRLSQEQLAFLANVSPRHLSCMETGKAQPSRQMVLLLARALELELREKNSLLLSAGYAAAYPTTPLDALAMTPVSRAMDLLLAQQEPYGAVLLDRLWNVRRMNAGAQRLLMAFLDPRLVPLSVATNLVRASLHPDGLRSHIVNFPEVAALLLERLERSHHAHPEDAERHALLQEVRGYPGLDCLAGTLPSGAAPVAVLQLRLGAGQLKLFSMLTTLGTPLDVTAEDLTIESFFPADEETERWFQQRRAMDPSLS